MIMDGWTDLRSFFKKQQSCSFGVSLFASLCFHRDLGILGGWDGFGMYGTRVRDGSVASDF